MPLKGAIITLNDSDRSLALDMAKRRIATADKLDCENKGRVLTGLDRLSNDFEAAAGEIAFCKLFKTTPDYDNRKFGGGDFGDCEICGLNVDVKTANNKRVANPRLMVFAEKKDKTKADLFALMWGFWPTYEFRGFITYEDFFKNENLADFGYGLTYAVNHWYLKNLEEITVKGEKKW